VHQVAKAGDRLDRDAERLEDRGLGGRRRRYWDRVAVILVVDEPDLDAARLGSADRVGNSVADRARQADVVERELEAAARALDEVDDPPRDVLRRLASIGQLVEVETQKS